MPPRICLEKIRAQDFEDYYLLAGDSKVMELITGKPQTREEALKKFNRLLENGEFHLAYGGFKVVEVSSGRLLGFAKLEVTPDNLKEAELGYMLLPESWGRGYGSEIAAHLMKRAEADPGLCRVYAIIDPNNMASKKILLRLGFQSEQRYEIDGWPSEIFGRRMK